MFLGTFTPKLLGNSQLVLPAKIRASLEGDSAIITTGFDQCLYGFSPTDWEKIALVELSKPLSTAEGRAVRRAIFAAAEEITIDGQGRFVLSETLRKYAGIISEILVIGAGDHFEIWDKDQWTRLVYSS